MNHKDKPLKRKRAKELPPKAKAKLMLTAMEDEIKRRPVGQLADGQALGISCGNPVPPAVEHPLNTLRDVSVEAMPKEVSHDPWEHRSYGMRCRTCMFYVEKLGRRVLGRCRRNAPTMNGDPVVFPIDWCGEHKLDENKPK